MPPSMSESPAPATPPTDSVGVAPDPNTQFTSTYPMHGEVFLRAPLIDGSEKMRARIAAITFDGSYQQYSIRYADGTLLTVGVHEIDSPST